MNTMRLRRRVRVPMIMTAPLVPQPLVLVMLVVMMIATATGVACRRSASCASTGRLNASRTSAYRPLIRRPFFVRHD